MENEMENEICPIENYTRKEIPETEFLTMYSHLLGESTGLFKSARALFIGIYPLLRDGEEWGSMKLFKHCTADPVLSQIIKNRTKLTRYLNSLTELGFLKKQGDKKITYSLGDSNLKELRVLDQIFHNPKFRRILEENYVFIHIITCVTARLFHTLFPEDPEDFVFDLASVLIQAGVKIATKDLGSRRVVDHPCPKCIYPSPSENENSDPLDAQIKQFIGLKKEGVLQCEIIDFFALLDYSQPEINQLLQELINQDEVRINAGRYILNT